MAIESPQMYLTDALNLVRLPPLLPDIIIILLHRAPRVALSTVSARPLWTYYKRNLKID